MNIKQLIKSISLSCLKLLLAVDKGIYCQQEQSTFLKLFLHSQIADIQIVKLFACGRLLSFPAAL